MTRYQNLHIAPKVLALCQQPRTAAEVEAHFPAHERQRARYALYNLVKQKRLRNLTQGKCGPNKVGRFVVSEAPDNPDAPTTAPLGDGGTALARAWGRA